MGQLFTTKTLVKQDMNDRNHDPAGHLDFHLKGFPFFAKYSPAQMSVHFPRLLFRHVSSGGMTKGIRTFISEVQ